MTSMVEIVARAIYEVYAKQSNLTWAAPWGALSDGEKQEHIAPARAAILALREPTEEMFRAGALTGDNWDGGDYWRAMIDEALK